LSTRDKRFRYSVYSDVLVDWPNGLRDDENFSMDQRVWLAGTDENERFSISQISPGFYNANTVAFYFSPGQLLMVFVWDESGKTKCLPFRGVAPDDIEKTLNIVLSRPYEPLALIMGSYLPVDFDPTQMELVDGCGLRLCCTLNTMPSVPDA